MEPWRCGKGSKYYNKIKNIRDILKSLSGGNIPDMLIALLTADEVIFYNFNKQIRIEFFNISINHIDKSLCC